MGPEMVNLLGIGLGIDQPKKNGVWSPPKFKTYFCISLNCGSQYCKIRQRQILFCDNAKCDVLSSNSITPNSTPWFQICLRQILCCVPISITPNSVSPNSEVHQFLLSNIKFCSIARNSETANSALNLIDGQQNLSVRTKKLQIQQLQILDAFDYISDSYSVSSEKQP